MILHDYLMTKLTVYGTPVSTYVRTTRLLLEEAGAEYNLRKHLRMQGRTKTGINTDEV